MKMKLIVVGGVPCGLAVALVCWKVLQGGPRVGIAVGGPSTPKAMETTSAGGSAGKKKAAEEFVRNLRMIGFEDVPPAGKVLAGAVNTGDRREIIQAFHRIVYSRAFKREEVLSALQFFKNDTDSYVRFEAGIHLLIMGEMSGEEPLRGLVRVKEKIPYGPGDLRVLAATTLGQFRCSDCAPDIALLFEQVRHGEVWEALANLGSPRPNSGDYPFQNDDFAMEQYGKTGERHYIADIDNVFRNAPLGKAKLASAWALWMLDRRVDAAEFLVAISSQVRVAKFGTFPGVSQEQTGDMRMQIVKYLGCIDTPTSKAALEEYLECPDSRLRMAAAVNLVLNHEPSEKLTNLLVREINGPATALGVDLTLNLANRVKDPRVIAAGELSAKRDGLGSWNLYTRERASWSIYSWCSSYVMKVMQ